MRWAVENNGVRIMSILVVAHMVFGLVGIAAGAVAVLGIFLRRRMRVCNLVFLLATAGGCGTGFVFLPSRGVTSAQLVGFFVIFLLLMAAYARYVRKLEGSWNQVYAFTVVGALFFNILITTAQSFLHMGVLNQLAPTQDSPVYVSVKVGLLVVFVVIALVVARRAGEVGVMNDK